MKRTYFLLSVLLLSGSTLWGQGPGAESAEMTVTGCLVSDQGIFVVNANDKHYQLAGKAAFQQYVGKQVRVVGKESYSKKPGTGGKAENMVIRVDSPTFTVSKIEKLADTCDR